MKSTIILFLGNKRNNRLVPLFVLKYKKERNISSKGYQHCMSLIIVTSGLTTRGGLKNPKFLTTDMLRVKKYTILHPHCMPWHGRYEVPSSCFLELKTTESKPSSDPSTDPTTTEPTITYRPLVTSEPPATSSPPATSKTSQPSTPPKKLTAKGMPMW